MLQYKVLIFVVVTVLIILTMLAVIAFIRRYKSNQNVKYSVDDIWIKFFSDYDQFSKSWPEFCKLVGTRNAYEYLNDKTPVFEKFFPITDLYYENLEEFLTHDDGDISELTVKNLFDLFYMRLSPK